jgi:hypothetical protein
MTINLLACAPIGHGRARYGLSVLFSSSALRPPFYHATHLGRFRMSDIRHYCRNTHCRSKLKAPVENEHHAFCAAGCYDISIASGVWPVKSRCGMLAGRSARSQANALIWYAPGRKSTDGQVTAQYPQEVPILRASKSAPRATIAAFRDGAGRPRSILSWSFTGRAGCLPG